MRTAIYDRSNTTLKKVRLTAIGCEKLRNGIQSLPCYAVITEYFETRSSKKFFEKRNTSPKCDTLAMIG